jgi:phosphatidylserine/phosphatidylglycerophosphate/cardiolipin synthase-like enzyme
VDPEDGFAISVFQNGLCVELGHCVAYAMPVAVQTAWIAAGGLHGTFGAPTSDPMALDGPLSVQEFALVARIFGGAQDFTLQRDMWEASIAGGGMIGLPLNVPQAVGSAGAVFVPHDSGVVLAVPEAAPQPLPQAVFDAWSAQETGGTSLGAPTAFGFPGTGGDVFPFLLGSVTLRSDGTVLVGGPVTPTLQRYFQPGDITQHLTPRLAATRATPLIGGADTFTRMRDDIRSATGAGDFVYILSWHCNVDFPLVPADPASSLRSLLTKCAAGGVQIRAMLWAGDPVPAPPTLLFVGSPPVAIPWELIRQYVKTKTSRVVNQPAVDFINGLLAGGKDGAAILDSRQLPMGSHHQKAIIVKSGARLIAYVGGIEPNLDRIPPPVAAEPGSPLFDIAVRLEDAAAFLVLETFIVRWDLHPDKLGSLPLRGASVALPLPSGGPMAVQVTHTYGRGFPFTAAVQTASTALANGIRNAKQFFYMEDQYFVGSPKMDAAIREALTLNPSLIGIIVIAAEDSVADLPDLPFRRRVFLNPIAVAFPGRFLVFERLGFGSTTGPTAYVHTKLLLVDDEAAFIGSVNSNRRSWFHDSEIDATIVDMGGPGGVAPGTRGVVREFRCALWSDHLTLPSVALGDFPTALAIWQAIISGPGGGGLSVRAYDVGATVPRFAIAGVPVNSNLLQLAWDTLEDPT